MSKNWDKGEEITAAKLNDQGLKVSAQDTPGLTLKVAAGVAIVDGTTVKYAGGNTGTISAPASNPRIDLVCINSAGVISITTGVEGASPSAPAYPADKTVLAEVYCRVGMTEIVNVDTTGKGYIYRDSRPLGAGISLINASTGSADAGKGIKTDASGLIDDTFMFDGFGDGSDGNITLNGSTDYTSAGFGAPSSNIYTMTRDVYCNNLTINSGVELKPAGWRIYVKDTISGAGKISFNGAAGTAGTNDARTPAGTGGAAISTGFFRNYAGGDGGTGGTSGNDGAQGGIGNGGLSTIYTALGGRGGNGGRGGGRNDTSDNSGSSAPLVAPIMKFGTIRFLAIAGIDLNINGNETASYTWASGAFSDATVNSHTHTYVPVLIPIKPGSGGRGGGGGHGYTSSGSAVGASAGGGGASGGVVFIAAKTWAGTFTIEAKGGNGGAGGNRTSSANGGGAGGSGGGGGGVIVVIYNFKSWTGSTDVSGGTKGAKGTQTGGTVSPTDGTDGAAGNVYQIKLGKAVI